MIKQGFFLITLTVLIAVGMTACDSDPNVDDNFTGESIIVSDVAADPPTGRDNMGQPIGTTGHFTLYSLRENKVITGGDTFVAADSNSTKWDIGFRGSTIITNGGTSGPGSGGAMVMDGVFEELETAPQSGYAVDSANGTAIPAGSGNGWYNYNPQLMVLVPIPGRVLVIRTADGRYAKVRILSYYQGAPDNIDPFSDLERFYTFEFVFQPNGSTRLK
jgi:hypothetical protein